MPGCLPACQRVRVCRCVGVGVCSVWQHAVLPSRCSSSLRGLCLQLAPASKRLLAFPPRRASMCGRKTSMPLRLLGWPAGGAGGPGEWLTRVWHGACDAMCVCASSAPQQVEVVALHSSCRHGHAVVVAAGGVPQGSSWEAMCGAECFVSFRSLSVWGARASPVQSCVTPLLVGMCFSHATPHCL
jgi:hypothetical protein